MNLTLRQFLVFKTIVESDGFRKAAEVLHTSATSAYQDGSVACGKARVLGS